MNHKRNVLVGFACLEHSLLNFVNDLVRVKTVVGKVVDVIEVRKPDEPVEPFVGWLRAVPDPLSESVDDIRVLVIHELDGPVHARLAIWRDAFEFEDSEIFISALEGAVPLFYFLALAEERSDVDVVRDG